MSTALEQGTQEKTQRVRQDIQSVIDYLREDVEGIDDPRARAMFETAAEVLIGLDKAFSDYELKTEEAWK